MYFLLGFQGFLHFDVVMIRVGVKDPYPLDTTHHGLINYKDTLNVVFTGVCRVYRLEIQSVMLAFSTGFVSDCPSNLLSRKLSPPLPV